MERRISSYRKLDMLEKARTVFTGDHFVLKAVEFPDREKARNSI